MNHITLQKFFFCIFLQFLLCEFRLTREAEHLRRKARVSHSGSPPSTFCKNPVSKAKVSFPESIIGRAEVDYEMYSGYVNVTGPPSPDYLFYWFFSARNNDPDAPLIIWTNGGPGCSAMEGATTEIGPLWLFDIKESCTSDVCDFTRQLSNNPYSWNAAAAVLFLDQPRNVGYSFGHTRSHSSKQAAQDLINFYLAWLQLFPDFRSRKLIIAGESYGGHYVPAWSDAIMTFNAGLPEGSESHIPLSGIVIGNGLFDSTVQSTETYIQYLHDSSLIPADSTPRNGASANAIMRAHLAYSPNYYDYRLRELQCEACYAYNYSAWASFFLEPEVLTALSICGDAGVDAFEGAAGGCIDMPGFDSPDTTDSLAYLGRALDQDVSVTLYYGKADTVCDYVGGYAAASAIPFRHSGAFKNATFEAVQPITGLEIGQHKRAGKLSFYQFDSSGHMVPMDKPEAAYIALYSVLKQVVGK